MTTPSGPGRALVRRPGPRLSEGLVTHIERSPVDGQIALRQWRGYVDVLSQEGWSIIDVPAADDCPDAVFVEDAVVVFGELAVVTRPGAPQRRPETVAVEATVSGLGYQVASIVAPGTLDGGDVLKVGSTVYVGSGGRTNPEGVEQLRRLLEPRGAVVRPISTAKVLHLKSAVTALPDGTVIGYPELVDDAGAFESFLAVPEESGAHVVLLGGDRVLIAASAPKTAAALEGRGLRAVAVDISEFEKLEGCVTCLSVRLRD